MPKYSFEAVYESIMMMVNRLPVPFSHDELLEILKRNVLQEIKKNFLYVSVHSAPHFRLLCAKRERFIAEEVSPAMPSYQNKMKGHIASVEEEEFVEENVSESKAALKLMKCYNCNGEGHIWKNCVQSKTVLCDGCGEPNVHMPNCSRCFPNNSENRSRVVSNNTRIQPQTVIR